MEDFDAIARSPEPREVMQLILPLCIALQLLFSGCAMRLDRMSDVRKAEVLATEQGRVMDLMNPVEKTKSHIVISRIFLDFAAGAAREGDFDAMQPILTQYVNAIRSARDAIMNSDRDAQRRPEGYRDLELILREHVRRLEDYRRALNVDQRVPVEEALKVATTIREEMLRKLFPTTPNELSRFRLIS
jgi:hypothetical protein